MDLGLPREAAVLYRAAIALDPNTVEPRNNLGVTLLELGRFEEAVRCLRDAVARDDTVAAAHENLGNALRKVGDIDAADDAYAAALALQPSAGVEIKKATLLPVVAESAEDLTAARRRMADSVAVLLADPPRLRDAHREVGATNFNLSYHDTNNRDLQADLGAAYMKPRVRPWPMSPTTVGETHRIRTGDSDWGSCPGSLGRMLSDGVFMAWSGTCRGTYVFGDGLSRRRIGRSALAQYGRRRGQGRDPADGSCGGAATHCPRKTRPPRLYRYRNGADDLFPGVRAVGAGSGRPGGTPRYHRYSNPRPVHQQRSSGTNGCRGSLQRAAGPSWPGAPTYYERPPVPHPLKPPAAFDLPEDVPLYFCAQTLIKLHPEMDALFAGILERDRRRLAAAANGIQPATCGKGESPVSRGP